jgi:hypothetical protein
MNEAKMRPTYLPDCQCEARRLIVVDGIIRCGTCYMRYSEGGSYYYTDGFLKSLIDTADENDKWYQYELRMKNEEKHEA